MKVFGLRDPGLSFNYHCEDLHRSCWVQPKANQSVGSNRKSNRILNKIPPTCYEKQA